MGLIPPGVPFVYKKKSKIQNFFEIFLFIAYILSAVFAAFSIAFIIFVAKFRQSPF